METLGFMFLVAGSIAAIVGIKWADHRSGGLYLHMIGGATCGAFTIGLIFALASFALSQDSSVVPPFLPWIAIFTIWGTSVGIPCALIRFVGSRV